VKALKDMSSFKNYENNFFNFIKLPPINQADKNYKFVKNMKLEFIIGNKKVSKWYKFVKNIKLGFI